MFKRGRARCTVLVALAPTWAAAAQLQIHSSGYGPVKVGMTVAEAQRALSVTLPPDENYGLASEECGVTAPSAGHPGVSFMIQYGRISRATVTEPSRVQTPSGIGIGAPV